MTKIRQTINRKPALVYVDGEKVAEFKTEVVDDEAVSTAISQAEAYVEMNKLDFLGKSVEILVKYKEFAFSKVETVKMEEL